MKVGSSTTAFGLSIWHGHPDAASEARQHDELELVLVERGSAAMQVGVATVNLGTGGVAAFWALAPHRVLECPSATLLYRLTVPVPDFLQWQLPRDFSQQVLGGKVVTDEGAGGRQFDRALFRKWLADFKDNSADSRRILLLEIEARLRRLARSGRASEGNNTQNPGAMLSPVEIDHAMTMGRFIAEHYTETIHDADIARAAHLNERYAMRLFSRALGIGMHKRVNDYRIAHACRLLATTNHKVIDLAMASGFASLSRFYETFIRGCGETPRQYQTVRARREYGSPFGRRSREASQESADTAGRSHRTGRNVEKSGRQ